VKKPPQTSRSRILTQAERKEILDAIPDEHFRQFVFAMQETGARPSEVRRVTANNVNLELGIWVFFDHKTMKKTGKPRVIYLTPAMVDLSRQLMEKYPEGPLFRGPRSKRGFTRNGIRCRFRNLRRRLPHLKGVVPLIQCGIITKGESMRLTIGTMVWAWLTLMAGAATDPATTLSRHGWTITADVPRGVLSISQEKLGPVLVVTQFHLRGRQDLHPLKTWSVEKAGPEQLSVLTQAPRTRWVFEPQENDLIVRSTSADAVLTAKAPASQDRLVARLLDTQGVPVEWTGTGEVVGSYQGSWTRNRSFLPRRNPECMYFALGPVASPLFHSLFDRKTDTARALEMHKAP